MMNFPMDGVRAGNFGSQNGDGRGSRGRPPRVRRSEAFVGRLRRVGDPAGRVGQGYVAPNGWSGNAVGISGGIFGREMQRLVFNGLAAVFAKGRILSGVFYHRAGARADFVRDVSAAGVIGACLWGLSLWLALLGGGGG